MMIKFQPLVTDEARVTSRNLSALVLLKAIQYPFLFLFFLFVPKMMGADIYGEYALFLSIVMIGESISCFAFSVIFGRFIPEFQVQGQAEDIKKVFGNALFLQNLINILLGIPLFLVLYFTTRYRFQPEFLILMIAIVVIRNNYILYYDFLFGLNELAKCNSMVPLRRILSLAFIFVLFKYYGITGAIFSTFLVDLFLLGFGFYWTRSYFSLRHFNLDIGFIKPFMVFALTFFLSGMLSSLWMRLGNIFVEGITHSTKEVAIYDIPNQIFNLMVGFISPFVFALSPIFTKLHLQGKQEKIRQWSSIAAKYMGILCTMSFFGFLLTGEEFLRRILGPNFEGTYINSLIQLAGIFPLVFMSLGSVYTLVYKKPALYFWSLVATLISFSVMAIVLVPKYGAAGSSVAMTVSCFVMGIIMMLSFPKEISSCIPDFGKTFALGLIFLPLTWMDQGLTVRLAMFAIFAVIYLSILFAMNVLSRKEFLSILEAIRKKEEPASLDAPA